jgi:RecB family exonuclease
MDSAPIVAGHISVSRVKRYAQCPKSYELHYVKKKGSTDSVALSFGKVLHAALERTYRQIVADRVAGVFPRRLLVSHYRYEFGRAGLTDFALFDEGLAMLKDYVAQHPYVEHDQVLGIEQEFRLPIDRFEALGYIDRIDRIDAETVEVVDYKSNRQLFSREDVETDIQLSVYAMAARALYPWAKKVRLSFYMLRHALRLETTRTPKALDSARQYVAELAEQMETASSFPARLNANCAYCDHRGDCDAYAQALRGEVHVDGIDPEKLDDLARARQQLTHTIKILNARKDELDAVIKDHLKEHDALVIGGVRFSMFPVTKNVYPLRRTVELISSATRQPQRAVFDQIAVIDNSAVSDLLKKLTKDHPRDAVNLLKCELEAAAETSTIQRLWAKEVR